jgi:hypothetical protein
MFVTPSFAGRGPATVYGPSPGVWGSCPLEGIALDPNVGWMYHEDWTDKAYSYTSATAMNGYLTYQDTGVTIATAVTGSYVGIPMYLQIAGADADNDEGSIQWGVGAYNVLNIDTGKPRLWFETAVRFQDVADVSYFIGLADDAAAAADFMTDDTGAIAADEDVIGFRTLVATPTELDAIYQTASATLVEPNDACATLAASSTTGWRRLGLVFDGSSTMKYYVDGLVVATADCEATGFPDGVDMAPFWAMKDSIITEEKKMDIGWWRIAQAF